MTSPKASASWRAGKTAQERGYTYAWRKARARYLQANPLCAFCKSAGQVTMAEVVDHITPHEGNQELFWDESNWQALCKRHHDSDKQRLERSGTMLVSTGVDGWPM